MQDSSPLPPTRGAARRVADPRRSRTVASLAVASALVVGAVVLGGCTPKIGDKCVLSTDCSTQGDRLCDTSQPDGYCTEFNCQKDSCPDQAACVMFDATLQGCGYDDRAGGYGSRVARAFCVATCGKDSDCRSGYLCSDPRVSPWDGLVLDSTQAVRTCLVIPASFDPDASVTTALPQSPDAAICGPVGPAVAPIDASTAQIFDGSTSTPVDAGVDADASDASDGD